MKRNTTIIYGMVVISFLVSIYFYPFIPEQMVTHWNEMGRADGSMGKIWGMFFIPFMLFALAILFRKLPEIDPLKGNIDTFRGAYERFVMLILLFLLSVQLVMILWNMGRVFDFMLFFAIWIAILFYDIGELCKKSKRNWFIGVRTPWTMNSDSVWEKTNRLAGSLFHIYALVILLGIMIPGYFLLVIVVPMIIFGIVITYYSYSEYQKEIKGQTEQKIRPREEVRATKKSKEAKAKKSRKTKK